MIIEIVSFQHPEGATREELLDGARGTLARWQANPDLVRKHYACSPDRREGMGIYLWPSVAAAQAGHDAQWIAQAEARTGGPVHIRYLDLLMVLDNEAGAVLVPPASEDLGP
ncbi:MAG: hypothetical protein WCZ20_05145 [Hydrogenophaga sp.]|jgi:hypothetical protein|uniref:hypothetical protein n=1 Tax=Hydrogenophaga sp. TaxID=1904254 RepID=UPI002A36AF9C|nr:hypothetical protein [Hydrogenophaga sp.]MDX9969327.1 hypothetical protein [Hydrogenophaga sp.]